LSANSAWRTAREVASPAAQLLREPVLGAWRYVRNAPPSIHAFESALTICSIEPPSMAVATAVDATRTSNTWSRPTRLKLFSSASTPWISCALIIAVITSRRVSGFSASRMARRDR
jgi:hypothetical protein